MRNPDRSCWGIWITRRMSLSGGIGRHAALRTQCLTACGFDSCLGYLDANETASAKSLDSFGSLPNPALSMLGIEISKFSH